MSVLRLSLKEFADIAASILHTELSDHFFTEAEVFEMHYFNSDKDERFENEVKCFVERLYIGNSLAFQYMYGRKGVNDPEIKDGGKIEIERLDARGLDGSILTLARLSEELHSLRYNLFTNSGNSFISEKDSDKLHRLIDWVDHKRLMQFERSD